MDQRGPDRTAINTVIGPQLAALLLPATHFNRVQSVTASALLEGSDHVLVGAPTGSGKTMLLEMAVIALFKERLLWATMGPATVAADHPQKAVYISPIKALASEKFESMRTRFGNVLTVVMETGDGMQWSDGRSGHPGGDGGGGDAATPPAYRDPAASIEAVLAADIIITTPERWDSITRRWRDGTMALALMRSVALLLIDEVHVVGEGAAQSVEAATSAPAVVLTNRRGAVLEAIVSRMKTAQLATAGSGSGDDAPMARLIAVSGTLPNACDLAAWLGVKPQNVFEFREEDRPVPLSIRVIGYPRSNNPFLFERFLNFKLLDLIRQYSADGPHDAPRPALVFCSSRKETCVSACHIADEIARLAQQQQSRSTAATAASARSGRGGVGTGGGGSGAALEALLEQMAKCVLMPERNNTSMFDAAMSATDRQLRHCLLAGVAFHHAALCPTDRKLVEDLFRDQYVSVCCTTSTLAMGVNLPARLVVIKGTTFYRSSSAGAAGGGKGAGREDMPLSELMQMAGRAGRLGLDTKGVALVLTTDDKKGLYAGLDNTTPRHPSLPPAKPQDAASRLPPLESQLHLSLIDHVNAEVALRTIQSVSMGLAWIQTTFWWVRLQKNPTFYLTNLQPRVREIINPDACEWYQPLRALLREPHWRSDSRLGALLSAFASHLLIAILQILHNEHLVTMARHTGPNDGTGEELSDHINSVCDDTGLSSFLPPCALDATAPPNGPVTAAASATQWEGLHISPTRIGYLAARFYIDYGTVEAFNRGLLWRMLSPGLVRPPFEFSTVRCENKEASRQREDSANDDVEADDNTDHQAQAADLLSEDKEVKGSDDDACTTHDEDDDEHAAAAARDPCHARLFPPTYRVPPRYLLMLLCHAKELVDDIRIRMGDKRTLNKLHKGLPFPLLMTDMRGPQAAKGPSAPLFIDALPLCPARRADMKTVPHADGVKENWHKIFVMLQVRLADPHGVGALGDDFSLRNDMSRLWNSLPRLTKFLTEYCAVCVEIAHRVGSEGPPSSLVVSPSCNAPVPIGHAHVVYEAWVLQRSIERGIWGLRDSGGLLLRQLDGVTEALARQMSALPLVHGHVPHSAADDLSAKAEVSGLSLFSHALDIARAPEGMPSGRHAPSGLPVDGAVLVDVPTQGRRLELLLRKQAPFGTAVLAACLAACRWGEGTGKDPLWKITPSPDETERLLGRVLRTGAPARALVGAFSLALHRRTFLATRIDGSVGPYDPLRDMTARCQWVSRNTAWRVLVYVNAPPFTLLLHRRIAGLDEALTQTYVLQVVVPLSEARVPSLEVPVRICVFSEYYVGADSAWTTTLVCRPLNVRCAPLLSLTHTHHQIEAPTANTPASSRHRTTAAGKNTVTVKEAEHPNDDIELPPPDCNGPPENATPGRAPSFHSKDTDRRSDQPPPRGNVPAAFAAFLALKKQLLQPAAPVPQPVPARRRLIAVAGSDSDNEVMAAHDPKSGLHFIRALPSRDDTVLVTPVLCSPRGIPPAPSDDRQLQPAAVKAAAQPEPLSSTPCGSPPRHGLEMNEAEDLASDVPPAAAVAPPSPVSSSMGVRHDRQAVPPVLSMSALCDSPTPRTTRPVIMARLPPSPPPRPVVGAVQAVGGLLGAMAQRNATNTAPYCPDVTKIHRGATSARAQRAQSPKRPRSPSAEHVGSRYNDPGDADGKPREELKHTPPSDAHARCLNFLHTIAGATSRPSQRHTTSTPSPNPANSGLYPRISAPMSRASYGGHVGEKPKPKLAPDAAPQEPFQGVDLVDRSTRHHDATPQREPYAFAPPPPFPSPLKGHPVAPAADLRAEGPSWASDQQHATPGPLYGAAYPRDVPQPQWHGERQQIPHHRHHTYPTHAMTHHAMYPPHPHQQQHAPAPMGGPWGSYYGGPPPSSGPSYAQRPHGPPSAHYYGPPWGPPPTFEAPPPVSIESYGPGGPPSTHSAARHHPASRPANRGRPTGVSGPPEHPPQQQYRRQWRTEERHCSPPHSGYYEDPQAQYRNAPPPLRHYGGPPGPQRAEAHPTLHWWE